MYHSQQTHLSTLRTFFSSLIFILVIVIQPLVAEEPPELITTWGSYGTADGQFHYTTDVGVGPNGLVYVADGNHRIQVFDSDGNFLFK